MRTRVIKPYIWLAIFIMIISPACGPASTPTPEKPTETAVPTSTQPPPTPTPVPTQEPTAVPEDEGKISKLEDVRKAVIQIEAQGTIVNPDFSVSYNTAGLGSGFIIDPAGLAVTNNHVVTGAGLLKVWIGGDTTRTYNAKVLGVSECSDLALIDLEGDGYPYLAWRKGPINVGLEVYAAGYPLGEPQFTLTKGIVSKEQTGGETSWASVDVVIEHDATINPGNSGGPLLDEEAQIVAVNYRGRETNQYFAIGRDLAVKVIEQLKAGEDVDSIGVNGEAFVTEDFSGIWVYSIEPGSPADKSGVQGGDIITTLQNLVLASDGTMADYCDILRSHSKDDTLNIEVLRYFTSEVLQGQINGEELQTVVNFGEVEEQITEPTGTTGTTGTYSSYVTVQDDTGAIQMDIPVEWGDVDGTNWETDWGGAPFVAASLSASANLASYYDTYGESGVFFAASDRLSQIGGYIQLLDGTKVWYESDCDYDSRTPDYLDSAYEGAYDLWVNCGNEGGTVLVLAARPFNDPTAFLILVEVKLVKDADLDALQQILASFDVIGGLP